MNVNREWLEDTLCAMELVYNSGRGPAQLSALAEVWAHDLAGQNLTAVEKAMTMHRRESRFFPTPADIIRLMPRCAADNRQPYQLPEPPKCKTEGMGQQVRAALQGDDDARTFLARLLKEKEKCGSGRMVQ